jgi:site-specific recombinase XerD
MNTSQSLKQLVTNFIDDCSGNEASRNTYKNNLAVFIQWIERHADLADCHDIKVKDIRDYQFWLKREGKAEHTVNSYLVTVKLFYKYLYDMGIEDSHFLKGFKVPIKNRLFKKKILSELLISKLLSSIDKSSIIGKRDYAIINLISRMGLRCIEVCRLDIEDFYYEEGRQLVRIQRKGSLAKDDIQGVTDPVISPIRNYWNERPRPGGDPAFINHSYHLKKEGPRLDPKTINVIVKKHLKAIGIVDPLLTAHSLRHSCATIALANGAAIYDIKALMAHKSLESTQIYVVSAEADIKKKALALSIIDKAFQSAKKSIKNRPNLIDRQTNNEQ